MKPTRPILLILLLAATPVYLSSGADLLKKLAEKRKDSVKEFDLTGQL
jgi:hypothetical protein